MSEQNVATVRAALDAWNAGDMEAFRELLDAEIVLHTAEGWPEPGPFEGREAAMRELERARAAWDADRVEPIGDLVELADRVVMRFIWRGVGHGLTTKMEMTSVFTLRGRRIVFWEMFREHADALEAAGRPD